MFTIPLVNIKADPLDALLAAIGYRLISLAKSDNSDYRALLDGRHIVLQLTSGTNVARYYQFDNGIVSQHLGIADHSDLAINFKDSMTGVRLLTKGNAVAFMSAVQDGEVTMEGDFKLLLWFASLGKHVSAIPDEYKPYIDQAKPYIEKAKPYAKQAGEFAMKTLDSIKKLADK